MKNVAIYCLDQDRPTTSSLGILNHTKQLLAALSHEPDPGFQLVVLLSDSNHEDLSPTDPPAWMITKIVPGTFGTGFCRVWADQVLSRRLAARNDFGVVHFPKGWIPALRPGKARVIATIHDTVPEYLNSRYPSYAPWLKRRYFAWAKKHALRSADRVVTISAFSRSELIRIMPGVESKISVIDFGPGISLGTSATPKNENRMLVLGSRMPHKATAETLRLLAAYSQARDRQLRVSVPGITEWLDSWSVEPAGIEIDYLGKVSDQDMRELMASSRLLVFLSEFEGLGLPPLEAYDLGTAVCYRNSTALSEVLEGTPGGWDGRDEESFFDAMDEALSIGEQDISATRDSLRRRYNWANAANAIIGVYAAELGRAR